MMIVMVVMQTQLLLKRGFVSRIFNAQTTPLVALQQRTVQQQHDCPCHVPSNRRYQQQQRRITTAATTITDTNTKDTRRTERTSKFTSLQQLQAETDRLIAFIRRQSSSAQEQSTSKNNCISMDQLHQILEAWMEACMAGHGIYAAQQGLLFLQAMEDNPSSFFTPPTSYYNVVLHSFAVCQGGRVAAETAHAVLQRMLMKTSRAAQPTTKTFHIVMNCWAKSHERDAGLRAEELYHTMHQYKCPPNARTTAVLIEAWGNSGHKETPQRVLSILQQATTSQQITAIKATLGKHDTTDTLRLVSAIVFTNAIRAVTRHPQQQQDYIEQIVRLMQQVHIQPDTRTYAALLHAYTATPDAAVKATTLLQHMMHRYRAGAAHVIPNAYCFTTCIAAWARCKDVSLEPHEQAERLWQQLLQLYLETADEAFRPSVQTGNAVLMAWMRATHLPDAMEKGHDVLERMRQCKLQPNRRSYNTLLNGMNWRGMGKEALELITWMEQQAALQPDLYSFNSVLAALAKDRTLNHSQQLAEDMLRKMELSHVGADRFSYATVLDAWARSQDDNKARRAEALVQVMTDRYIAGESTIKPDCYIFTNVIKACIPSQSRRYHEDNEESRNIAFRAMDIMKSGLYGKPNNVAYTNLFHVIAYTYSNEEAEHRRQLLNQTLVECAGGGHVSARIVELARAFNMALPTRIPASWSDSVPLRDRPIFVPPP